MNDNEIVALYLARDEQALVRTEEKYGGYCFQLANRILNCRQDAEETVSDTYLKAWQSIPPHKPAGLRLFLAKIARNLAFDRWRSQNAQKRGGGQMFLVLEELEECISTAQDVGAELEAKELTRAIARFLDTQPEREQNVFLRRYFFVEDTGAIALRYGMKPAAVLKSLSRTRQKLKSYLIQEGYTV
ncbi:MAG: sigma-70 family RNA polymerase sigma factor [Firmicutes bacterium]|nr:sigma-70 family RNA polymerase sigma factor [Bacillota bacterium]MDY6160622.1 sigma-70 family RNA polymerase sigma factor [Candidatus Faecousia sp.]